MLAALAVGGLACGGTTEGEVETFETGSWATYACPVEVFDNLGGRSIATGAVEVTNDIDGLNITIIGVDGWLVDEWHVYAGTAPVPVNGGGNPAPGRFPYQDDVDPPRDRVTIHIPFTSLGVGCNDAIVLAVHTVVRKNTSAGWTEQTAWAWEQEFTGARWGGSIGYTVCCNEPPPPPPDDCVLPPWYWGQTPSAWPAGVSFVDLGVTRYTKSELLAILGLDWTQAGNDISIFLAHQAIAARLNLAAGNPASVAVVGALAQADAWFDANRDSLDGRIPFGVSKDSPAGAVAEPIAWLLGDYNTGMLDVASCNQK